MNFEKIFPTPKEHTYGKNTCRFLVQHHTATGRGTRDGVINGLAYRDDFASCHYLIDEDGLIFKFGNDYDILWHCGDSQWDIGGHTIKYLNYDSIGIELIGPLKDKGFTDKQIESLKKLTQYLCKKHNIPKENILRHKDIAPGRKIDPADTLWNKNFESYEKFVDYLYYEQPKMSKYTNILKQELESGVEGVFTAHEGNHTLTEQEIKELIDIAIIRLIKKLPELIIDILKTALKNKKKK